MMKYKHFYTEIEGATEASYTVPTDVTTTITRSFYCEVTYAEGWGMLILEKVTSKYFSDLSRKGRNTCY